MRFNKRLRSNLFYWCDVSGYETDGLANQGSSVTAIKIKSGMAIVPDFLWAILKIINYLHKYGT